MATEKDTSEEKVIVLDLKTLMVPLAIIISGAFIGIGIYLGLKDDTNEKGDVKGEETQVVEQDTVDPEPAAEPANEAAQEPEITRATVSIDDDAILGNRDTATIAVIEFSDLECPFCQRHHQETYPQIVEEYVNSGEVIYVFRDLPLSFHEPVATEQALAAECVHDLAGDTAYFDYLDLVFDATGTNGEGVGGMSVLTDMAAQLGVERAAFSTCVDNGTFVDEIQKDAADAAQASITGTPGFVVGKLNGDGTVDGEIIRGAYPFDEFQRIIEKNK